MTLAIWPNSIPFPAGTTRQKNWNANVQRYDSGAAQGIVPFAKPLYEWNLPFKNYTETKQGSLWGFWDDVRGPANPFLMKDAYDFRVNSVLAVRSGISTGTFYLYDTRSFFVRADTTTIGSMFSALSGYVLLGTNYWYDMDTGIGSIILKSNTDVWGVRSMQYWRKCRFEGDNTEASPLWNIFASNLNIVEEV